MKRALAHLFQSLLTPAYHRSLRHSCATQGRAIRETALANPQTAAEELETNMDPSNWTNDEFLARRAEIEQHLARVTELEQKLARQNATYNTTPAPSSAAAALRSQPHPPAKVRFKKPSARKPFDPSKYTSRFIALKFAYLGSNYNGFEHHANNTTPLPTIEEELWKALKKTRLILPMPKEGLGEDDINWEGCEYSKCGRTDRGVSAFGQVIGIRVRSSRPIPKAKEPEAENQAIVAGGLGEMENAEVAPPSASETPEEEEESPFDDVKDELPYARILNCILPPDIRILAWCPNPPPNFSARFSCKERRYKYFFTNPGFAPMPGPTGLYSGPNNRIMREGWLDIGAMREAASYLVGLHDFRNFCKLDPAKQITNFQRRIFHASIERWNAGSGFATYTRDSPFQIPGLVGGSGGAERQSVTGEAKADVCGPGLFTFNVHGSAFLWHQVRHLVAILFLVGQGLEPPSIVKDLLDVSKNPAKPRYNLATDTPLVLWDCIFPEEEEEGDFPVESKDDALDWIYMGDDRGFAGGEATWLEEKFDHGSVMANLWEVWHKRRIDEALAGSLLDIVARQGPQHLDEEEAVAAAKGPRSARVFDGGDAPRLQGQYIPVMKKGRMEEVDVLNERYLVRKGLDKKDVAARQQDDEANE